MSKIIAPTIGRRLWFWPGPHDAGYVVPASLQAFDAGVAYVHSDHMLNISYVDHAGVAHSKTSVPLVQPGEPKPEYSFCQWMPFQVGQASNADTKDIAKPGG